MHGKRKETHTTFWSESLNGRDHLEHLEHMGG